MSLAHRPLGPLALVLPLALASCTISHGADDRSCRVDGRSLRHQHEETLAIEAWHERGLAVAAHCGDVRLVPTDGPSSVTATVREREVGDARLVYADGEVRAVSASGEPAALRNVVIRARGDLAALRLSTGLGDVEVEDARVAGDCALETGLGDVRLARSSVGGSASASTGMGDVEIREVTCASGRARSGMGDVTVRGLKAGELRAGTGMGDVELFGSTLDHLEASTGMGDVRCVESSFATSDLTTGMGSVTRR